MKFELATDAVVYWKVQKGSRKLFKQYFNYGKGDGLAFLEPARYLARYGVALIIFVSISQFWFLIPFWYSILPLLFLGIWIKDLRKIRRVNVKRLFLGVAIAVIIETAPLLGHLKGAWQSISKHFASRVKSRQTVVDRVPS
jgi:hypothetical protein